MSASIASETSPSSIQLVAEPPFQDSQFESFQPSRFDHIYLFDENDKTHCRYHLRVVDCPSTQKQNARHTAVFLIPAGRESEYLFSTQKGLWSVAESAQCARLIAVALGRFHEFEDESVVTSELVWVIQVLGQQGRFLNSKPSKQHSNKRSTAVASNSNENNGSIPILKMDGIGQRNIVAQGETSMSGQYLIEQVKLDDRIVRRLYFMDNPFVIQSEVVMLPTQTRLDKAAIATMPVDKSQLAFEYHHYMAAGILALAKLQKQERSEPSADKGLIVGLGGAGLVNFLQHVLDGVEFAVVELDPTVVTVAESYFGFTATNTRVIVGDGLQVQPSSLATLSLTKKGDEATPPSINESATNTSSCNVASPIVFVEHSLSFIVIDVDSKDKTVGMSCPPLSFCQPDYLQQLKSLLKPDGILAMNVSARDSSLFHQVCQTIQTVFGHVVVASHEDDDDDDDNDKHDKVVNVALFAWPKTVTTQGDVVPSKDDLVKAVNQCLNSSNGPKLGDDMLSTLLGCLSSFSMYSDKDEESAGANVDANADKKKKKKKKANRKKGRR